MTNLALYELSDVLGAPLSYDPKAKLLAGRVNRTLTIEGQPFAFDMTICSSVVTNNNVLVVLRGIGNLVVLVNLETSDYRKPNVDMYLLNRRKMDAPSGVLEMRGIRNLKEALFLLDKAIVAGFSARKGGAWTKLDLPAAA